MKASSRRYHSQLAVVSASLKLQQLFLSSNIGERGGCWNSPVEYQEIIQDTLGFSGSKDGSHD